MKREEALKALSYMAAGVNRQPLHGAVSTLAVRWSLERIMELEKLTAQLVKLLGCASDAEDITFAVTSLLDQVLFPEQFKDTPHARKVEEMAKRLEMIHTQAGGEHLPAKLLLQQIREISKPR